MRCPLCRYPDSRVIDSRTSDDGLSIRRRRECPHCKRRFTTLETASLTVLKRSGATEPFSRDKIMTGVGKACQGRPVTEDDLALLAQQVEEKIRETGAAQISAGDIGLAILEPLRKLDDIAYLRFASVYSNFDSLDDFEREIAKLRKEEHSNTRATESPAPPSAPEPQAADGAEGDSDADASGAPSGVSAD
ncbi:MAG: transcriptional regulator NrdR [Ancrocorticia sp.]|nr:transcriptional regulator NrdR [Ancrocorticia sp.]MCI1895347.1 transcriptional regulator NrdR [Ancrocorticia sp.]MCI1932046.1 transcriptional regulator NrdR [Ancrocorticia sp.]